MGCTLAQQGKETISTQDKEEAIRHTLRLYEQMFISENLDVLNEILHPMAILCWQSENPHTLSREDCRRDLRETFGRRNYRKVKIYDTQIDISGNIAALTCKEVHSFKDFDIDDKYFVDMILVYSNGRWRILTKVTTRQTRVSNLTVEIPKGISAQKVIEQYGQPHFWGRKTTEGSDGSYGICGPGRSYAQDWFKEPAPTEGNWLYVYSPNGLAWSPSDTVCFVSIKEGIVEDVSNGRLVFCDP